MFIEHYRTQLYVYEISLHMFCIHNCIQMNVKRKVFDKDIIMDFFRTSHLQVILSVSLLCNRWKGLYQNNDV